MFNLSDEAWGDYPETAAPVLPSRAEITPGLMPAQVAAAAHNGAILVLAGAGTGRAKTTDVTLRVAVPSIGPDYVLCGSPKSRFVRQLSLCAPALARLEP